MKNQGDERTNGKDRKVEWLPAVLAAMAFIACLVAFAYELFVYQGEVIAWSKADLESRAELTAATLAEPLRTLDFKGIHSVADRLMADGLRLRITQGPRFFVAEGGSAAGGGFFDTCVAHRTANAPYVWSVARTGDYHIGVGRPSMQMMRPFIGALLVAALAGLVGVAGVLLFFIVTYRQRVRIRELARIEKFRREFIADVSHEIKTPLTGILGTVDLLEEDAGNLASGAWCEKNGAERGEDTNGTAAGRTAAANTRPLLQMLKREALRLNGLVQAILDLARLEREGDVLNRTETDLGELIAETVASMKPSADAAGIRLAFSRLGRVGKAGAAVNPQPHGDEDPAAEMGGNPTAPAGITTAMGGGEPTAPNGGPTAKVDAQLLAQAVANLIGNAIRHSGSDIVAVSLERSGKAVQITVEDHGVGIPPEHAEHIFERFHRVDPARAAATGGAGLGLAIVRRIARLHGGEATFAAVKPHGSRFVLSIPTSRA